MPGPSPLPSYPAYLLILHCTGMINEERMSVYVRLGIRLLYKGMKSNSMEGKRSTYFGRSFNNVRDAVKSTSRLSTSAAHAVWQGWITPALLIQSSPTCLFFAGWIGGSCMGVLA